MTAVKLLDSKTIDRTLSRIGHEILEKHKDLSQVVLVGIKTRGIYLAERLVKKIELFEKISLPMGVIDITLYRDDNHTMKAKEPIVQGSRIPFSIEDKHVILVDDVLFTGRTIRAAMDAVMDIGRARTISVAVLIDRGHRELPIKADFIGKNMPTSLQETIFVKLVEKDDVDEVVLMKK